MSDAATSETTPKRTDLPPAYLPPEILPLYDWWKQNGASLLTTLTVVVIALAGSAYYLRLRSSRLAAASAALGDEPSVANLETAAGRYGGTRVGPLVRIRLAKSYFDAGQYAEALGEYDKVIARDGKHSLAAAIAAVGRAHALEALQRTDEALAAYVAFAKADPAHFLAPQAILGQARCLAIAGRKAEAKDLLDRLMVSHAQTPWEEIAKNLAGAIDRFEGFRDRSIFEQLGAASKKLDEAGSLSNEPQPAAKPVAP